jgi:hypothetical protein
MSKREKIVCTVIFSFVIILLAIGVFPAVT